MQPKVNDVSLEMIKQTIEVLRRGNRVEWRIENNRIVILEIERKLISKNDITK